MKFAGGNHYHEHIKYLHLGEIGTETKETEYSNRRQSVLPRIQTGADT